jgi:uncharacterized protein (DUF1330 family)
MTAKMEVFMSAYVLSQLTVNDYKKFRECIRHMPETLAKYGGELVVASQNIEVMEGCWDKQMFIALEFPCIENAKNWYESDEYRPYKAVRQEATDSSIVFVDSIFHKSTLR